MIQSASFVALIAVAALTLGPLESSGFIRIMGNSDAYCGYEGSYCYSNSGCCSGLVCRYGYKRYGGVCEREAPASYDEYMLPPRIYCQSDSDCPPSRCCVSSNIGFRGATFRTCEDNCQARSGKDFDTILGEYYNRYYRTSYRKKRSSGSSDDRN